MLVLKNLPAITRVTETWVQLLGKEEPLEKVMAPHSSVAWRIAWWAVIHRVAQTQT